MPLTPGDTTSIHRMIYNLIKRILSLSKSNLSIQHCCIFKTYILAVVIIVILKSTRFWKWAPAQVCRNKNVSTHRITTPFVSADTHGLKEVFKSIFWILKSTQNIFSALKVGLSCSSKCFILTCDFYWFLTQVFKQKENMQKSLPPHVCDSQNRLNVFLSKPRTLLERLKLILTNKNSFSGNKMRWTKYFQQSLQSLTFQNS